MTHTPPSRPPQRSLSERLDREWSQLRRRPAVLARVRSWALTEPGEAPLAGLDDLLDRTGYRGPGRPPTRWEGTAGADALLGRLVGVAATEPLAARVVLQRILPGLLAVVRAEQRCRADVDAFEVLIGEAWVAIASYRTEARPTDVAARLLNDARHRAFSAPRRRRRVVEVPCPPAGLAGFAPPTPISPFEELVDVVAEARRFGLGDGDLALIAGLVAHGSAARLARTLQLTDRAVRYRRQHAVEQIRRLVGVGPDQNTGGRLARNAAIPSCASREVAA